MRKLGTLPDIGQARRFAAVMATRGIGTTLRPSTDGTTEVWAVEEDRVDAAREELAAFRADPAAERFRVAVPPPPPEPAAPPPIRRRPTAADLWRRCPVTLGLIVASVAVTVAISYGEWQEQVRQALSIAPFTLIENGVTWDGLARVRHGEVWRLFMPIFLHFGAFHLVGNMTSLWVFGSAIEITRGWPRMLILVLVLAAVTNYAEYRLNLGWTFDPGEGFRNDQPFFQELPMFGGMSGVVFGLFGLIWTRSRLLPESGFRMPRDLVVWMLIWTLACTAGFVGPIANVAHLSGLAVGMAIGAAPRLWRGGRRGRRGVGGDRGPV